MATSLLLQQSSSSGLETALYGENDGDDVHLTLAPQTFSIPSLDNLEPSALWPRRSLTGPSALQTLDPNLEGKITCQDGQANSLIV